MSRQAARWLALFALIAPPLSAQTPPSLKNVVGEVRFVNGSTEQDIVVINASDYPVIVTDLTLKTCVNVKGVCGVRKRNVRVAERSETVVLRLTPGPSKILMTFEYAFDFKLEDPNSPTAIAARKTADSLQKVKDLATKAKLQSLLEAAAKRGALSAEDYESLVALPAKLEVSVGETVDLTSAVVLRARSASGRELPVSQAQVRLASGGDVLSLEGGVVKGLKPGAALLMFSMGLATDTTSTKGVVQVPVTVVP